MVEPAPPRKEEKEKKSKKKTENLTTKGEDENSFEELRLLARTSQIHQRHGGRTKERMKREKKYTTWVGVEQKTKKNRTPSTWTQYKLRERKVEGEGVPGESSETCKSG